MTMQPPPSGNPQEQPQSQDRTQAYADVASQLPPSPAQPQAQLTVIPKNPVLAVVLSVFVPGLGSMTSDNASTGALILAAYIVGVVLSLFLIGIPIALGAWVWGLFDAHKSAVAWNARHGFMS
jgi:hypothetical protein